MKKILCVLVVFPLCSLWSAGPEGLAFLEHFSWGERTKALEMLVPNTDEFYYFTALHHQLAGEPDRVETTLRDWRQFLGNRSLPPRYREIRIRQRLLDFDREPGLAWEQIRRDLSLTFNHRRRDESRESTAPSRVNPSTYDLNTFHRLARQHSGFPHYSTRGLEILETNRLHETHRRVLLTRIDRPDFPGLLDLILADLAWERSEGFGSISIHNLLSTSQLEELARRRPELLRNGNYITQRLARIPAPDTNLSQDHAAAVEHFSEVWDFVRKLEPMHNSLKASVAFRLMDHQRHLGIYDEALFRAYLDLPRQVHYLPRERREQLQRASNTEWVDFRYRPGIEIPLPPIIDESPLVREFLIHFQKDASSPAAFERWFEESWLNALFAESKILHGVGRPEDQRPRLSPAQYRSILDRVELDFAATNPAYLKPGEAVELEIDVKRVDSILIKIYELQTFNYYSTRRQPVDQAVDLDGLVATHERRLDTAAAPGRRIRHSLAFPEITERGVYVVELIGGGVSSRALLHIGHLESVSMATAAGQAVMIMNESGEPQPKATLWIDGREFSPGEQGVILVPYSESPGSRFAILRQGDFSHPERINHLGETYQFTAGIHVDPQNLPRRRSGRLVLRPDLRVNGIPLDPALLGEVTISLASVDARDTRTEREFKAEFTRNREWTREFYVPDDLRGLEVKVTAKIRRRTDREEIALSDSFTLPVNTARTGDALKQIFLQPSAEGWWLEVRGLNGEPIQGQPLNVHFHHPAVTRHAQTHVATDADGRVFLDHLRDIERIVVSGIGIANLDLPIPIAHARLPETLHVRAGETLSLAHPWAPTGGLAASTLLRMERGVVQEIVNDRVRVADGEIRISNLPAGEYDLRLHESGQNLTLIAIEGDTRLGYLLGERRRAQETVANTPSVREVRVDNGELIVDLRHATQSTRLALRLARYAGPGHNFPDGIGYPSPLSRRVHPPHMQYVSGRNIGDEYRYVLDRQGLEIFAGTLLERPGLILNPWELRETTAERERLKAHQAYRGRRQEMAEAAVAGSPAVMRRDMDGRIARVHQQHAGGDIGFDFLPQGSQWITNLSPDENGLVRIPLEGLEEQTFADIVVLDRFGSSRMRHPLPDTDFEPREVRLLAGLDPEQSFSRQKTLRGLAGGEAVTLPDLATSRYQLIRSFGQAYDLLRTLGGHAHLNDFDFLKHWPELENDEKRAKYGEFASHELHLFLHARDPEFFDAVVRPYLANKKDKTFVDRWLLETLSPEDLRLDTLQDRNALELALLARRGDRDTVLAALREQIELIPDDPAAFARLIRVALQSADLDETIAAVRQEAREMARATSTSVPAPAARAMGGRVDGFAAGMAAPEEAAPALRRTASPAMDSVMSLRESQAFGNAEDMDFIILDDLLPEEAEELFRALPKTKEWAEQNYYRLRVKDDVPDRIPASAFWVDVAAGDDLSAHLLEAHRNFTEVIVALAFSGLPFEAEGDATEETDSPAITLASASPALLITEQILPAEDADDDRPLLISQQFYRPDDRYRHEGNEQIEKFITGEFIRRTVYGARVTLTNPTANRRRLNTLMQIPRGAIPVNNGFYTDDRDVVLEPYTTRTIEFHFTFPFSGEFEQFPAHAAADEAIIGRAERRVFNVVDAPTEIDKTSWAWVSQNAEPDEVLEFLDTHNLRQLELNEIAWRMRDAEFFARTADLLASRLVFHDTTFSYAIHHQDVERARVWLPRSRLADMVGPVLDSPLLTIDPVTRKTYEHLEYDPLVNPRAHQVGAVREILNPAVNQQYRAYLANAAYMHELNPHERLGLVYYLLLQDRLGEARDQLALIDDGDLHETLQADYLRAWMALRELDTDSALALAEAHIEHPVPRWRERFAALAAAVREARGGDAGDFEDPDRQQRLDRAAATAPALDMKQDAGRILVHAHNLPLATLNLYPMDIELLFSRRPFQTDGGDGFGIVRPALSQQIDLPVDGEEFELELPEAYRDTNMVVELSGRGQRASVARFANRLNVRVIQSFGQLEVRAADTNEFLPRTYIKVYARGTDGRESFWKDGYTDLRGRFDYLSLNDRQPEEAIRFSILVLHPEHGAHILEATPPVR